MSKTEGEAKTRLAAHATAPGRDEAVVPLPGDAPGGVSGQVALGGLLASLPAGAYSYNLLPLAANASPRFQQSLEKGKGDCAFPVTDPGLYDIQVFDRLHTLRVDMLVAVTLPHDPTLAADFEHARKVLTEWDEQYYGWPVHDILRLYLRARMTRLSSNDRDPNKGGASSRAQ